MSDELPDAFRVMSFADGKPGKLGIPTEILMECSVSASEGFFKVVNGWRPEDGDHNTMINAALMLATAHALQRVSELGGVPDTASPPGGRLDS